MRSIYLLILSIITTSLLADPSTLIAIHSSLLGESEIAKSKVSNEGKVETTWQGVKRGSSQSQPAQRGEGWQSGSLVIVLLGGPGSGKSTQAKKLESSLHLPVISTGEIFRYHVKNQTDLGKEVARCFETGQLLSDELVAKVVFDRMTSPDCQNGAILDGFPRTLKQAALLRDYFQTAVTAFHIELDDEEAIERMTNRMDNSEVVKQRLAVYHEQTEPLIVFYKQSKLLTFVDGLQSVDAITHQMLQTLSKEAEAHATAACPAAETTVAK